MEDNVLVVDVGSSSTKLGFAGDDVPAFCFPSTTTRPTSRTLESIEGWAIDSTTVPSPSPIHPVQRGLVTNWDQAEAMWSNMFDTVGLSNLETTSILVAQSIKADHNERLQLAKLLFDKFHVPSICLASSAMLSILASGRTSGLAVESGAGLTSTVPVFEGFALKHAITSMDFGGQDISALLHKSFFDRNIYIDYSVAMFIKEKLAHCSGYRSASLMSTQKSTCTFPLPDGNEVTVDSSIMRECTEPLFLTNKFASGGMVNQVRESIMLCDDSIKSELAHNIILSGGNSMLPGFGDKLFNDLMSRYNWDIETRGGSLASVIRVIPNSQCREAGYTNQRKFGAWIGGSLLSSFDTYHKSLKITRQEWEENGEAVLEVKNY